MKGMNGLRMFIRLEDGPVEDNIFYSQRSHGPIYRWHYEKHLAKWLVTRVNAPSSSSQELYTTLWRSVPHELKTQLSQHYVE